MATSEVYFEHWRRYFVGKRHVLLLGVLAVSSALAQTDRGTITGTITDSSGAVIPGAAVHARNTGTGAEYETVATSTGNYTLPSLPAGTYDLTVTANGFSTYNQHGIGVEVVQTLRVDVALQVGSASESVTVTADAGLLRTENAEISHNLSTERVDALPNSTTNVRDPFAFASIMPGVVGGTTAPAGSANIKVNGSPATAYKVLLDGQDITNTNQDPSHTLEQQPAVEALQEFTLQASNFSAEFGQITGGLFNLTTKSGTNGLHGVAFVFVRNEDLGAGKPYSSSGNGHLLRPRVRGRNYGGAIGGPVVIPKLYNGRNKTFFFANLELYRNYSGTDTFVTMPTVAMKNGDFSQALTGRTLGSNPAGGSIMENMIFDPLSEQTVNGQLTRTPFPNNVIPTNRLDPVALKIQSWFPDPTRAGLVNNWEQRFVSPEKRHIPRLPVLLVCPHGRPAYPDYLRAESQDLRGYLPASLRLHGHTDIGSARRIWIRAQRSQRQLHAGIACLRPQDHWSERQLHHRISNHQRHRQHHAGGLQHHLRDRRGRARSQLSEQTLRRLQRH
jgi:hypothetical protein